MAKRMKNMWMFVTPGIQRPSSGSIDGRPMRPRKLVQNVPADATRPATVVPRVVFWSRSGAPGTLAYWALPMFSTMRMMAGPRMTMKSEGKMQPTSGKSILMGALAAISSAR